MREYPGTIFTLTNAFSAGALLACAFYLMLFEATHLIKKGDEARQTADWGTMIITGFLVASVIDFFVQAMFPEQPQVTENGNGHQQELEMDNTTVHMKDTEMANGQVANVGSRTCCETGSGSGNGNGSMTM